MQCGVRLHFPIPPSIHIAKLSRLPWLTLFFSFFHLYFSVLLREALQLVNGFFFPFRTSRQDQEKKKVGKIIRKHRMDVRACGVGTLYLLDDFVFSFLYLARSVGTFSH
jgi:hypothetical protein